MLTQTQDPASPSFNEDLYNILMGPIEPDLTTAMIPVLDELYFGETQEENAARMQRYAQAIEMFKTRAAQFADDFKSAIWSIGEHAMNLAHDLQNKSDASDLKQAESNLDNA